MRSEACKRWRPNAARAAFASVFSPRMNGVPASITYLTVDDAKPHWNGHTHEYYCVLEVEGALVIDGERVPVAAGDCVWIKPGAHHYAEGSITSLIIAMPAFDPAGMSHEGATAQEQTQGTLGG